VKFGTTGWRERYYKEKFAAQTAHDIEATRKDLVCRVINKDLLLISKFLNFFWFY
ncbi:5'-3' exoribonuclease 3, partial [Phtheirospermum japonicum]